MKILRKKGGGGGTAPAIPDSTPKPAWENPLIPTKRLRELYSAMVELRLIEAHIASSGRRRRTSTQTRLLPGQEACLVSTLLSLNPSDLTSVPTPSMATAFLRGTKLTGILHPASPANVYPTELPAPSDSSARLYLAIGSALALASSPKKGSLTVAYANAGDLSLSQWKPLLKLAASSTAPILFVLLPRPGKSARPGQLSLAADACAAPGIPVDASDPIALYRVAQESMLRIRAGGGPVLMECIPFQVPDEPSEPTDPILRMQQLLLPRGVATEVWFEEVAARFASRLKASGR